jgi:hypothetical protein
MAPKPDPPRPKRRPAPNATEKLRNLYASGDESGKTPPDKGETFAGLRKLTEDRWDSSRP